MRKLRHYRHLCFAVLVAAGCIVASPPVANSVATGVDPQLNALDPVAYRGDADVLEELAHRAEAVGVSDPLFSSVRIDVPLGTLTVYRADGGKTPLDVALRYTALATSDVVVFRPALLTANQVEDLRQTTRAEVDGAASQGNHLESWGLESADGRFELVYSGREPTPDFLNRMSKYGADKIVLREGSVEGLGRFDDTSPFYGGSRTYSPLPLKENCTAGFGVRSLTNGADYLTVAWHCIKEVDPRFWTWSGLFIGTVTAVNKDYDTAFVKISTSPVVYDGPTGDDYRHKNVESVGGFVPGLPVCVSGSVTKAECRATMEIARDWVVENHYNDTHHASVTGYSVVGQPAAPNGAIVATDGDSGGPVFSYARNNTLVTARGTISSGELNYAVYCPQYIIAQNANARCYRQVLVVNMAAVGLAHNLDFN